MKHSTIFRFVIAFIFICLICASATAQEYGTGISGYTSIFYDEQTNTVMAYSETNINYDLMGDYRGEVWLTVTKNSGVYVANGTVLDNGDGYAAIEFEFPAEPNVTYTAVGVHRARLQLWDYVDTFPYERFYFDNWYFTSFSAQNIYQPWYYYFDSPGNYFYRHQSEIVPLGRTYDSVSTQTYNYRGSIQAQGPDINYGNRRVDLGDKVFGNRDTVSRVWAQDFPLGDLTGIQYANTVKSKLTATQRNN